MSAKFDSVKTYSFIKGMAMGLGWGNTINALSFAREAHGEQLRKNGEPYIIHPLTMASHATALGIREDAIVAACLLHDVVEDCGVSVSSLPVDGIVQSLVKLLTYSKNEDLSHYYEGILLDKRACIVKLLDRCNNVSTMAGVFTKEKLESYIEETRAHVLPLLRQTKNKWPEYSNILFVLKYHIIAVIDGLEACLQAYDIRPCDMGEGQGGR